MPDQDEAKGAFAPAEESAPASAETPEAPAPGPQPTQEPDWKAQAEAQKAELERLQADRDKILNDLKALKGSKQKQADVAALLEDYGAQIKGIREAFGTLGKAIASGETEKVGAELGAIEQRLSADSAHRTFTQRYNLLREKLDDLNQDDEGAPVLDLDKAPELENIRQKWGDAYKRGDLVGVADALADATTIISRVHRSKVRAALEAQKATAAAPPPPKRAAEGSPHDLDSGPGAGGRGTSDAELEKAVAQGKVALTPEITARLEKYWNT